MIRLALDGQIERNALFRAFYRAEWVLSMEHQPLPDDDRPHEIGWIGDTEEERINWIDDHTLGVQYFVVRAKGAQEEKAISDNLKKAPFDFTDPAEEERALEREDHERALLAHKKLCVMAPEKFDEHWFQLVTRLPRHEDRDLRVESLYSLSYLRWPEIAGFLKNRLAAEEDAEALGDLKLLLEGFETLGTAG